MHLPLTFKAISAELAKRGQAARLESAGQYLYFLRGAWPIGSTERYRCRRPAA